MPLLTYKDLMAEAHKLNEEAKAILTNPDATTEELARVLVNKDDGTQEHGPLLKDAFALRARAFAMKDIMDSGIDKVLADIEAKNVPEGGKVVPPSEFKDWAEFLVETWRAGHPNIKTAPDPRLRFFKDDEPRPLDTKDMSGQSGTSGGFLIPVQFEATLKQVVGELSIVRSGASIIRMQRRQLDIPVLDQTGTTAGIPHWFGGLRFYWQEEASAKTESDASFRQVSLVAHKLIGYTRVSDELVDDSAISLADFFQGPLGFAGGIAWMEDYAFLRGTGAGQPLGIINAGATIIEPRNAANAIGFDDIADMMERFLPTGRGKWIITQSAMSEIIQMNGPAANPSYIWQPNARDGVPGYLMGFPVTWTEKLPAIGTQGDILLADLSYYVIGDRQATTIESTKFDRWQYDQTSWRVVHRVDGQPWLSAPLTLQDGTTSVSPFVILGGVGAGS